MGSLWMMPREMPPSGPTEWPGGLGAPLSSSREPVVQPQRPEAEGRAQGGPQSSAECGCLSPLWCGHALLGARITRYWPRRDRRFPLL